MTYKKALKVRQAALTFALTVAFGTFASDAVNAAGLGALTVQSALGQPLKAEIELSSLSPEELQTLSVRLASQQIFKQAGIEYNPVLSGLRLVIDKREGRPVVRITSTQSMNEPFLDLLVELNWASGRLVREYTFLLDPPELRAGKEPEPVAPVAAAPLAAPLPLLALPPKPEPKAEIKSESKAVVSKTEVKREPSVEPKAEPKAEAKVSATAESDVKVKSGDTLSKIAARHLPMGVTLEQMLVGLYRSNPESFVGNNMNRLKAGAVLRLPESADLLALAAPEARAEVVLQARNFADYRSQLARLTGQATPTVVTPELKSAQGQVTPKIEDKTAPKLEAKDQVKLARPQPSGAETAAKGDAAGTAKADVAIANEKALNEAKQRVAELERNVSDIQRLLAQQNETMAKAQQAAKAAAAPPTVSAGTEPAKLEAPNLEAPKIEAPKIEPAKIEPAKIEPAKAEAVKAPVPTVTTETQGWLAQLLENPLILGAGALILGLLGAGLVWNRRRRMLSRPDPLPTSHPASVQAQQSSVFVSGTNQTPDLSDTSFNSSFTPSASQIDSNEVDPIAEADVYIAYGRDAQAEEILKEALKITPERQAVRVKLLEIYASRKDLGSFGSIAGELYQQTNGAGKDWERASELGRSLDPKNPLYARPNDTQKQAPAPVAAAPDSISSDFNDRSDDREASIPVDFDLGAPTQAPPVSDVPSQDAHSSNASLSITEPSIAMMENPVLQATQPTPTLDFNLDASAIVTDDLDTGVNAESPKLSLDFDLNLPAATPTAEPALTLDLSSISLDLDTEKTPELPDLKVDAAPTEPLVGKHQEMVTKLDLAVAYQEIGDRDGAKELLEEVIRGGDPEQQTRAQKLLDSLD